MENYSLIMEKLTEEENELQFSGFSNDTALKIGNIIIRKGKERKINIAIEIDKGNQVIFHYSFDGTTPDNDDWLKRKINIVKRFHRSSYYVKLKLESKGDTLESKYGLKKEEYAAFAGAFPIIIKNTGVIGVISVSGLKQEDDHNLVVESLREYLIKEELNK